MNAASFSFGDDKHVLITVSEDGDRLKIRVTNPDSVFVEVSGVGIPGVIGPGIKFDLSYLVNKELEDALKASQA